MAEDTEAKFIATSVHDPHVQRRYKFSSDEHPSDILFGTMGWSEKYDDNKDNAQNEDSDLSVSVPLLFVVVLGSCIISSSGAILFVVGNFVPFAEGDGRSVITLHSFNKTSFIIYQIAGTGLYLFFLLRYLLKSYIRYLELYTTFIFNYDVVRQYNLQKYIQWISIITIVVSFLLWITSIVVWSISFTADFTAFYDANHDDEYFVDKAQQWIDNQILELTSTNSIQLSTFGLLMLSPVWILFVIFLLLTIIGLMKVKRKNNSNYLSKSLLLNESVSNNVSGDENKKYLYRVLLIHVLMLLTWMFWKWFVSPLSIVVAGSFLQGFTLKVVTTVTKFICHKLCDVDESKQLIYRLKNLKIIVSISTSVLFAFGLKFIFSNLKSWPKFFIISILLSCWKIMNGSFQSHLLGKNSMNRIKIIVNKMLSKCCCCCSKRLDVDTFDSIEKEIEFNKWLAFDISIQFIISASSCLIVMVYFAFIDAVFSYQKEDMVVDRVYELLSASFGMDCIVYFVQMMTFLPRDRKYFVTILGKRFKYKTSWTPDEIRYDKCCKRGNIIEQRDRWIRFLTMTLLLSWFWIGNMTGQPAVWQHKH